MAATRATFRGLPRRHRRVWKSRMAGLWRVAVTVAMQGIVRTEARPSQIRRWPGYRLLSRFRGTTPTKAASRAR